jgi:hypothetical protein
MPPSAWQHLPTAAEAFLVVAPQPLSDDDPGR